MIMTSPAPAPSQPKPASSGKPASASNSKAGFRWYELEFLVPYRDLVLALGFVCFIVGVFLLPRFGLQLGLLTLGAGLMLAAWRVLVQ